MCERVQGEDAEWDFSVLLILNYQHSCLIEASVICSSGVTELFQTLDKMLDSISESAEKGSVSPSTYKPNYPTGAEKAPCPHQKLPLFRSSMPHQPTHSSVSPNKRPILHAQWPTHWNRLLGNEAGQVGEKERHLT